MKIELPQQNNYEVAFSRAAAILRKVDLEAIRTRCGIRVEKRSLIVPYFNAECRITLPEVAVVPEIPLGEKILLLHYLTSNENRSHKGEYVSYKNLPGASFYNRPYRKRGTDRILKTFGAGPEALAPAAVILGGEYAEIGDLSFRFFAFPRVEILLVLYRGDEELPPEAEFLYRDDIIDYLSLEDIAVLSGVLASRLIKGKAIP